jgi:hypothetical protein
MEAQTQHRTTNSARLRFVLGKKATDVALPTEATLTELLPAVLPQFGAEWVEQGADHEGWVVQRVGEAPLEEDRTLAELNLLDGETVYLRPRADRRDPATRAAAAVSRHARTDLRDVVSEWSGLLRAAPKSPPSLDALMCWKAKNAAPARRPLYSKPCSNPRLATP